MGNLIKLCLFLTLFNISFSEEKFLEEEPVYEVETEEEVVTGKSLFFENSNLIRIEMRKDGDEKFGEEKENLQKKIEKLEKQKQILLKKEKTVIWRNQKNQRKIRDKKLLMLGIIFEITNTILYDENILLGHLFNFKKLNIIELDSLKKDGEKTFEMLKIHDKKMILHLSSEEKKQGIIS